MTAQVNKVSLQMKIFTTDHQHNKKTVWNTKQDEPMLMQLQ